MNNKKKRYKLKNWKNIKAYYAIYLLNHNREYEYYELTGEMPCYNMYEDNLNYVI